MPKRPTPLAKIKPDEAAWFIKNWVRRLCPDPKVIFDVGGLNGNQSREFATAFPKATVYCFEAHPDHVACIRENTKDFVNIRVVEGAADRRHNDTVTFWKTVGFNPGGSSLYRFTEKMVRAKRFKQIPITVRTVAIDTWAQDAGVMQCDVLWVDIQGHEGPMLAGMKNLLKTVQVAHVEAHYEPAYVGQTMASEIDEKMLEAGLRMSHWVKHNSVVHCGDAIYTREASVPRLAKVE